MVPLLIAGSGLGMLVSQLNNFTLAPIEEERASEAAGANSAAGNFGLSFGLAVAGGIMLATMSFLFTALTDTSTVIPPEQKQTIAAVLEDDAQVVSDAQLNALLVAEPPNIQEAILDINDGGKGTLTAGRDAHSGACLSPRTHQRLPNGTAPRPRALVFARRLRHGLMLVNVRVGTTRTFTQHCSGGERPRLELFELGLGDGTAVQQTLGRRDLDPRRSWRIRRPRI